MTGIDTAMILAAGRGERLRPLTDHTPKPLVEVGGSTLLERHIERLIAAGIQRIVINIAHLPEKIRAAVNELDVLKAGSHVELLFSEEPPGGLETAGGIVQALPLLNARQFLVVNADIYTDYDFKDLLARDLGERLAHLVMVDVPEQAEGPDFFLSRAGGLSRQHPGLDGDGKGLTFAGISLMRAELFKGCEPGWLALRPLLEQAMEDSRVGGEYFSGSWCDVGTLARLKSLRRELGASGS